MTKLITKLYSGLNAKKYAKRRKKSNKWKFETEFVETCLQKLSFKGDVADAPVGTNRFDNIWQRWDQESAIVGYDYSQPMLKEATKNSKSQIKLESLNLLASQFSTPKTFDIVLSIRFLNLIDFENLCAAIKNLSSLTKNHLIITIRTQDFNEGSILIENKIYVHNQSQFIGMLERENFHIIEEQIFPEERLGNYTALHLQKVIK